MRKIAIATLVAATAGIAPAAANDSSAELAIGGLTFVRNDDIEMRSEDLYISAAEIRVRYRFHNRSPRDVVLLVAFPLPEIRLDSDDANISVPTDDPVNIVGFATTADGRPVDAQVEQRVFAAGVDRTDYLRGLGVPLAPHLEAAGVALDHLPAARRDEIVKLGLAEITEFDAGKGVERHLSPRWGLRTTFHWQQRFAAGAETVIEHRYKPSVGASVQTSLGSPPSAREPWVGEYRRKYCIDQAFMGSIERVRRATKSEFGPPLSEQRIDYVLKTGANWAGPIGEFRLVIDKGEPSNLVSFCADGVRKTGATTFEVSASDFTAERELEVLIVRPHKDQ